MRFWFASSLVTILLFASFNSAYSAVGTVLKQDPKLLIVNHFADDHIKVIPDLGDYVTLKVLSGETIKTPNLGGSSVLIPQIISGQVVNISNEILYDIVLDVNRYVDGKLQDRGIVIPIKPFLRPGESSPFITYENLHSGTKLAKTTTSSSAKTSERLSEWNCYEIWVEKYQTGLKDKFTSDLEIVEMKEIPMQGTDSSGRYHITLKNNGDQAITDGYVLYVKYDSSNFVRFVGYTPFAGQSIGSVKAGEKKIVDTPEYLSDSFKQKTLEVFAIGANIGIDPSSMAGLSIVKLMTNSQYYPEGLQSSRLALETVDQGFHKDFCVDKIKQVPTKPQRSPSVPFWIKNNAGWWADGRIGDGDFISGIQFLIKSNIIIIDTENLPKDIYSGLVTGNPSSEIPAWIKNNAKWWADGKITDNDFLDGIKYLVEHGIIKV